MREDATLHPTPILHSIQCLRIVAASLVALFHAQQAFATQLPHAWSALENHLFGFGIAGVHLFFVISVFIMVLTARWQDGRFDLPDFLRRRFIRIYPTYWLCALAYVAFRMALGSPHPWSASQWLGAIALWPGDSARIIGPAWTLSYELLFYVCFGLAMLAGLRRGLIALAMAFTCAVALGTTLPSKGPLLAIATDPLLLEFVGGAGIGWIAVTGRLPTGWGRTLTGIAVAMFLAGLWTGPDQLPAVILWGVPGAILILGVVTWERDSGASQPVRWIARLGDSSYMLYLIHILLIWEAVALSRLAPDLFALAPSIAAIILVAIGLPLAEALHRSVERPLVALAGRRYTMARPVSLGLR